MRNAVLSDREISRRLGYSPSVVSRLLNKFYQTNGVWDRQRSGRPRVTSRREDGALKRLIRRIPFANTTPLATKQTFVRNRLRSAGYNARRPIGRPMLTPRHKAGRLF